jgi:PEGA domain
MLVFATRRTTFPHNPDEVETMPSYLRARRESPVSGTEPAGVAGRGSANRPWFGGLFGRFGVNPSRQTAADPGANELFAFPLEGALPDPIVIADVATVPAPGVSQPAVPRIARLILLAAAIVLLPTLALIAIRRVPVLPTTEQPQTGNLTINTRPAISEVLVDGERRGMTPLTLSMKPGAHTITVRTGGEERVVPLVIAAGADVTQYFEMKGAEPTALFGVVSVATDPPGARVAVDGRPRGTSPLTVADLTPEEHKVTVTSDAGSAERMVAVTAGGTASVMFSLPKVAGPVGGWLSISAPFDVEVAENQDVIGTSGTTRIMLASGRHQITLANRGLGYQEARSIDVTAGKTMSIRVDPPKASLSVNARPWAEIVLDGNSVGQTPIANLSVSLGSHEIVFRHPTLAERKQTVVVTAKGPNRIAADLTK